MPPDFLAIGHVAKDISPEGFRLGGTAIYSAFTALKMGLKPAIVTSVGPEIDIQAAMPGVNVHVIPSSETTTFRNTYQHGNRTQLLKGVAGPIAASDVSSQLRSAPLVMLGPLVGEVDFELAQSFANATVVASIQGWLRQWDDEGRVSPAHWEGAEVLPHVDAAVVSNDDIADRRQLDLWKDMGTVLIVTMGSEGAKIHFNGGWHHIAPFPVREVDPTGAGDVFGAAYLIRYAETLDVLESARFASCAASFCVEAVGVSGIPTRVQVKERLEDSL